MPGNPNRSPDTATRRSKPILIGVGIMAVIAIVGVAVLVWYFNQPVPEEVSLEGAVADVSSTAASNGDSASSGVEGTWTVDTSIGEFSFEDATSSFVGFRVEEELATIGATTAVGRTPVVGGSLTLAGTVVTGTIVEADLAAIVTNADRRNRAVQQALNTTSFPTATFTLTEPVDLGVIPAEGEPIAITASGDLEINGVAQPIEMPLEAQLVPDAAGGLIVVVGSVDIIFADWGVSVPSAPIVVSAADHGVLELQLFFTRS